MDADTYIAALRRELDYRKATGRDTDAVEKELARLSDTPHERARKATSAKAASARRRSV